MALLVFEHGWEELLDQSEVAGDVDFENLIHVCLIHFQDGVGFANAGIVNENRRIAQVVTNCGSGLVDCIVGAHVAAVEADT